ncbi:MAG: hypothetical protein U0470_10745 [Anaerolineae bacterium]
MAGLRLDAHVSGFVDVAFARLSGALYGVALFEQSDDLIVLPADTPLVRSATDPNAPRLPETPVGMRPMGIVVSPTEPRAYVYDAFGFDVAVVDLADPAAARVAARWPIARPAAPNPLADPVKLKAPACSSRRRSPPRRQRQVACASCHFNGEDDGRTWGFEKLPAGTAASGTGRAACTRCSASPAVLRLAGDARRPGTAPPLGRPRRDPGLRAHVPRAADARRRTDHGRRERRARPAERRPERRPRRAGRLPDERPPLMRSPHRAADGAVGRRRPRRGDVREHGRPQATAPTRPARAATCPRRASWTSRTTTSASAGRRPSRS